MAQRKVRTTKINEEVWYSVGDITEKIHGHRNWHGWDRYREYRNRVVLDQHPSMDSLMTFASPYVVLKCLAKPYPNPKQQRIADKLYEQISNRLNIIEESREEAGVKAPSVYQARDAFGDTPNTNTNTNAQKEHTMASANTVHPSTIDNQIFNFEGQNVRTVTIDNEPWFVLGDVCKVLEISNVGNAKKRLDLEDIRTTDVLAADGKRRQVAIINESGLYDVILDSRKPQAKAFRRWITSEVIPSIRKTGTYSIAEQVNEKFQIPQTLSDALILAGELEKKRAELEEHNKQLALTNHTLNVENYDLSFENQELKPLAEEYKHLMDSKGTYSMMDVAKILDIGRTTLFKFLRDEKVLMSQGSNKNVPYQRYKKYFRVAARHWEDGNGELRVGKTTYVYPEGLDWIAKKVRKAGLK